MKLFFIVSVFILFTSNIYAQSSKYQIIVNKDNPVTTLSNTQVKNIYTKKMTKWDDGTKIKPLDLQKSSDTRKSFSDDVLKKSVSAMRAFWQRQIFSGKGVPPPEKKSDADVIKYVKNNPGAIGYISSKTNTDGVKRINIK